MECAAKFDHFQLTNQRDVSWSLSPIASSFEHRLSWLYFIVGIAVYRHTLYLLRVEGPWWECTRPCRTWLAKPDDEGLIPQNTFYFTCSKIWGRGLTTTSLNFDTEEKIFLYYQLLRILFSLSSHNLISPWWLMKDMPFLFNTENLIDWLWAVKREFLNLHSQFFWNVS